MRMLSLFGSLAVAFMIADCGLVSLVYSAMHCSICNQIVPGRRAVLCVLVLVVVAACKIVMSAHQSCLQASAMAD